MSDEPDVLSQQYYVVEKNSEAYKAIKDTQKEIKEFNDWVGTLHKKFKLKPKDSWGDDDDTCKYIMSRKKIYGLYIGYKGKVPQGWLRIKEHKSYIRPYQKEKKLMEQFEEKSYPNAEDFGRKIFDDNQYTMRAANGGFVMTSGACFIKLGSKYIVSHYKHKKPLKPKIKGLRKIRPYQYVKMWEEK